MVSYKVVFFMGKGGVGKTTLAAAYSLMKASEGHKVLTVSLDPAHNLGDVFSTELSEKPKEVIKGLHAIEVDYDAMIKKHLKKLTDKIKDIYGYLRIFNLDRYVDVLQHSPGVEEQAALEKILEILKSNERKGTYDLIVFDTPPTGLMLRIVALPTISLIWVEKLLKLREAILTRRAAIERIAGEAPKVEIGGEVIKAATKPEEDPIYQELLSIRSEYGFINEVFKDSARTYSVLVINPEVLPVLEAKRAKDFLSNLGISVNYLIINKVIRMSNPPEEIKLRMEFQEKALKLANQYFSDLKVIEVPYLSKEPRGVEELRKLTKFLSVMK